MALPSDPHLDQPLVTAGPLPENAKATLIMVHGRGATAVGMLRLFDQLDIDGLSTIAPQAAGNTWYPHSFLQPIEMNQPFLDSALRKMESIVSKLIDQGVASEKIALLGFSQGACLASEFVARHPRRYGAVIVLTGGLIGPDRTPRDYEGDLAGTPIYLASGDPDPHVPFARVDETAKVLRSMRGVVDLRRYPGMPHTVSEGELSACRKLLLSVIGEQKTFTLQIENEIILPPR